MPKIKTKRAAAKRVRRTASGRLKRSRGWKRHKLEAKSPAAQAAARASRRWCRKADQPQFDRLVPYL